MDQIPWIEKYRPTNFDEIILDDVNRNILKKMLEKNLIPNMIFYGPPGTGKTTTIINFINEFQKNNNIELTINNAKPPIFWKDKEIIKQQISAWKPKKINRLIYKINDLELNIKKNISNSINIITDFLLEQTTLITNS